ncbi:galactose mutarotase-like [Leptidea sinapis]|uniref:galactose mutarotase-like n=1 Tax=Leptidea sinapis TaxID=189913 RepID=UPI0021C352DC|nr:galactose mutarotase-like [Leptidea sinapis]XP_050682888.1 galactose mutarotase-like [Leptidea sinapis]
MVHLAEQHFGTFNNEPVRKFTWSTDTGFSVSVISYGAIIQSIKVPAKNGEIKDVVLGFDTIEDYVTKNARFFGSTIGRCANRIRGGTFQLDGVTYQLAKNNGENHLHGGIVGFNKVNWNSTVDGTKVIFSYYSKDGEEGYPGDMIANVIYEVVDNSLLVEFLAVTHKKTIINMTNHSYFNLAGHDAGADGLYDHIITVNADRVTETSADNIPTGRLLKVGGTPFDLRAPVRLGDVLVLHERLFDHNFCVSPTGEELNFVSRVVHPSSGRYLQVYSNQPGVQVYTSYFLPAPQDQPIVGKQGTPYHRHAAFCLETQVYPDAVNHPHFPTVILKPGDVYRHKVRYEFGVTN